MIGFRSPADVEVGAGRILPQGQHVFSTERERRLNHHREHNASRSNQNSRSAARRRRRLHADNHGRRRHRQRTLQPW